MTKARAPEGHRIHVIRCPCHLLPHLASTACGRGLNLCSDGSSLRLVAKTAVKSAGGIDLLGCKLFRRHRHCVLFQAAPVRRSSRQDRMGSLLDGA